MRTSAVFDASNLHVGGAIQVASAFFSEALSGKFDTQFPWLSNSRFLASSEVAGSLSDDARLTVYDSGRGGRRANVHGVEQGTVWFDIFGSALQRSVPCARIAGFADVTSIYPVPFASRASDAMRRARSRVSLRSFRSADHLVVEAHHVLERLTAFGFDRSRITVVPNCYHPVFDKPLDRKATSAWQNFLNGQEAEQVKTFLYVARAYPHKNHDFLGDVGEALTRMSTKPIRFVCTLKPDEWAARSPEFRRHAINVGPVDIASLPALYAAVDGVVFPSLLECFSATPVEALRMGRPLIVGDHDFVRSIAQEYAIYCSATDPAEWANAILATLNGRADERDRIRSGLSYVLALPGSEARAQEYLQTVELYLAVP